MSTNDELLNNQELLQKYASGTLSSQEANQLNDVMATNPELAAEAEFYKQLNASLHYQAKRELKEKLKSIQEKAQIEPDLNWKPTASNEKKALKRGGRWLIGLAVLIAIVSLYLIFKNEQVKQQTALEQLAADYLSPYENIISYEPGANDWLSIGMTAYDQGEYPKAIEALKASLEEEQLPETELYLGISLLLEDQPSEALPFLQSLAISDDIFATQARWYLALSWLKLGEEDRARILLNNLRSDPLFGEKATALLTALDRRES